MPYVARNTFDPHYDVKRNWSAWIYPDSDTAFGVADQVIGSEPISRDLASAVGVDHTLVQDGYVVDLDDLWQHTDIEDRGKFEQLVLENCGLDIRYNEAFAQWQHCHHEGLSCWKLESENEADAIAEVSANGGIAYDWCGFGYQTLGNVRYVAAITDTLHIFWCEDVCGEV